MFIASCSVLPSRVENENFKRTIENLCDNEKISNVWIHYPENCKRLGTEYPPVPHWMYGSEKITVNRCADLGPLTKIAPLFNIIDAKADIGVFLFDDDRYYSKFWINDLLLSFESKGRKFAIGKHGSLHKLLPFHYSKFNISYENVYDDYSCIKTTFGAVYPFAAFPSSTEEALMFVEKYKKQGSITNDDMMLAAWCYLSETPIVVSPTKPEDLADWERENAAENDEVSLSLFPNHIQKQIGLAASMIAQGDFPCPWPDVSLIIGVAVFLFLFLIFIVSMIMR